MKYSQQEQIEATQRIRSRNTGEGQRTLATRIMDLDFPRNSDDYGDAMMVQTVSWATIYNRIRRFDENGPANLTIGDPVQVYRDGKQFAGRPDFQTPWVAEDLGKTLTVRYISSRLGVRLSNGFWYPRQTLVRVPARAATG